MHVAPNLLTRINRILTPTARRTKGASIPHLLFFKAHYLSLRCWGWWSDNVLQYSSNYTSSAGETEISSIDGNWAVGDENFLNYLNLDTKKKAHGHPQTSHTFSKPTSTQHVSPWHSNSGSSQHTGANLPSYTILSSHTQHNSCGIWWVLASIAEAVIN